MHGLAHMASGRLPTQVQFEALRLLQLLSPTPHMMPAKRAHPSVTLSLTNSEIRIIFHALSQDTSEAASALQGKLAGLIEVGDGTDGESDEAERNCELL